MGIRFRCPSCEARLNVKQHQAGQTGQCPHCSNPIAIPIKSTVSAVGGKSPILADNDASVMLTEAMAATVSKASMDERPHSDLPAPVAATEKRRAGPVVKSVPEGQSNFDLTRPLPDFVNTDVLADSTGRVWHIRGQQIGELGPLDSKGVRQLLDAGKLRIGQFVWASDWDHWLPVEKVFPQLDDAIEKPQAAAEQRVAKHRRTRLLGLLAILAASALIAGLTWLLIGVMK